MISPYLYPLLKKRNTSLKEISLVVCDAFDVSIDELRSKSRKRHLVDARIMVSLIAKDNFSKTKISQHLNKNHATIIHAIKQGDDLLQFNKAFNSKYQSIKSLF